jgi:hypothetical protein
LDGRCDITVKLGDKKTVICLSVSVKMRVQDIWFL